MFLQNIEKMLAKEPNYRLKQANQAIYIDLINSWDKATIFPNGLREKLNKEYSLEIKAKLLEEKDGKSAKALIYLKDGLKIEAVLMKHGGRNTVCVSSQVGCPMGCTFCATGNSGFERNLSSEEIIIQVLYFARHLKKTDEKIDNIVFMGMGEPLLNYEEVIKAINILNDKDKFNIGSRKISISTCGIPEGIRRLTQEGKQFNVALSLHAPNNSLRSQLMPINTNYSMDEVLGALKEYIKTTNRKVMIEYVMLKDINDSQDMARELARLLKNKLKNLYFVNLISYNKTGKFEPSEEEQVGKFKKVLEDLNVTVTERYRLGRDIKGACGQLAGNR
ncbi:MAG: 23S rRNA (adenine(2503)-C(2))-methyltransferase RlmN [Parcubacteria group bacterium]|nr:23S rRNA (adenine(2503)-C(2))-methyltransferase RlmN [Parcubacteria group bacterium]